MTTGLPKDTFLLLLLRNFNQMFYVPPVTCLMTIKKTVSRNSNSTSYHMNAEAVIKLGVFSATIQLTLLNFYTSSNLQVLMYKW